MNEAFDEHDDLNRPGCEPGRAAMHRLLDGEAAWDSPEAQGHRAQCSHCREDLALAKQIASLDWSLPMLASRARPESIVAQVKAGERRRLVRRWGSAVAVAACVLVAVVLLAPKPQGQTITEHANVAKKVKPIEPAPEKLSDSLHDARQAFVSLGKKTVDRSSKIITLPKDDERPMVAPPGVLLAAPPESAARKTVQPIAGSAKRAFNLLLKTVETDKKPQ